MRGSPRIPAAAVTAVILLTLGGCGGSTKTVTVTTSTSTVSAGQSSLAQNYVNVIGRVAPEVVQISTSEELGSGVVFDKRGDVVTNARVVAGGGPLQVTDSRGRRYTASLGIASPQTTRGGRAQLDGNAATIETLTTIAGTVSSLVSTSARTSVWLKATRGVEEPP